MAERKKAAGKLDAYTLRVMARRFKTRGKQICSKLDDAGDSNAYSTGRWLELDLQGDNLRSEAARLESRGKRKAKR